MVPIQEWLLRMRATDLVTTASLVCVDNQLPGERENRALVLLRFTVYPKNPYSFPQGSSSHSSHSLDASCSYPLVSFYWISPTGVHKYTVLCIRPALQLYVKSAHWLPWESKAIPQDKLIRQVARWLHEILIFYVSAFSPSMPVVASLQTQHPLDAI